MDMMEIRRQMMGVIAQMASGAQFEKGTFTVPNDGSTYKLNFGKSFSKYLLYIEADETSKTTIINTGLAQARTFCYVAIHPKRSINNISINSNCFTAYYTPSTDAANATASGNNTTDSSATFSVVGVGESGSYRLYKGLTYNYFLVEIK